MPATLKRLAIIGVGLIGGSIGLAARRRRLAEEIVGVVRSESSGRRAMECGAVDSATTNLETAVAKADVVVVCTPVSQVAGHLLQAASACPQSALLTDAGSTKQRIVADTEAGLAKLGAAPSFVGSHPLAGDHRTGPESARHDLLEGRRVVVTPSENSAADAVDRTQQFWRSLGAETVEMSPADHDRALSHTSHLPHLIAAAVATATPSEALPLTATGWRDHTRVAAGDPALWRDILLANRGYVIAALNEFEETIGDFRQAIADRDGEKLQHLLDQGRQRRDVVGD